MTNAEKFVEVFGTDLKRQYSTKSWWDQEFVPPKTGRWIVHPKGIYAHLVCDKCLSPAPYDCETNYCPNCGDTKIVEPQEGK